MCDLLDSLCFSEAATASDGFSSQFDAPTPDGFDNCSAAASEHLDRGKNVLDDLSIRFCKFNMLTTAGPVFLN